MLHALKRPPINYTELRNKYALAKSATTANSKTCVNVNFNKNEQAEQKNSARMPVRTPILEMT